VISTAAPLQPLALLLRLLGPAAAASAAAWALDWQCRRRGLMPPGFRRPWRRAVAFLLVSGILWVGVFSPLGDIGLELKVDLSSISTPRLFLLHVLMSVAVLGWFALGFAWLGRPAPMPAPQPPPAARPPAEPPPAEPLPAAPPPAEPLPAAPPPSEPRRTSFGRHLLVQLGLVAPDVRREVLLGLLLGLGAWGAVLLALLVVAIGVWLVGGENALPKPSAIVPWLAALPIGVRLLVSLSAGFVEEIFFRGFLQPRVGIALSTGCFVLAHVSYGQPIMLVGITLLSLIYAFLVRWRQTIWPAIAAHALFDGIQLLVIIPMALRLLGKSAAPRAALAVASGLPALLERFAALLGAG
jgi:membrane protease YdiL (CAAX protease family)